MDLVKTYGNIIKNNLEKPEHALKLITTGLSLEKKRLKMFPEKDLPKSYQYLNQICFQFILESLNSPENSAWVNLFAPTEIIHAFGIYPLSIEALSSFFSGFTCEDAFIDYAERAGIAETLCSYHKAFIGAGECKVLPKPQFTITSSMICDANINTFRYLSNKYSVPCYILDIPYEYTVESEAYVVKQLKELVIFIENITGKKFDDDKLKEVIKLENDSRLYMKNYLHSLSYKCFPNTLTFEMYKLITSHIFMGRKETFNFYRMLSEEIETYPEKEGQNIFWIHLLPFYHKTLRQYFNFSKTHQLTGCDLNYDFLDSLDEEHPFEALSKKLILNSFNGSFDRKLANIDRLLELTGSTAVINFSHWGCKQSSSGVMLLKEHLKDKDIPFLSIDGDGIDKRNSQDGQIRTRLEAFFEILDNKRG